MADKFHRKPFDEGTLVKLELLKLYIKSWLPVFIEKKEIFWKDIYIYDFFAGSGMDTKGLFGSPLIILNELRNYCQKISERNIKVNILINEIEKDKVKVLNERIQDFIEECRTRKSFDCCKDCQTNNKCPFNFQITSKDFKELFQEIYPTIKATSNLPRFMFIDQFGIKQVTHTIFKQLTDLSRTDFLFFISSSFVRRFAELEEFKKYLKVNKTEFDSSQPEHCHRIILKYYQDQISSKLYFLAPFSIKKSANIYGLIFGSNNPLGLEKFLDAAWSLDKNTGEANFNIDNDRIIKTQQLSLFPEDNVIKKVDVFEKNLIEWLKNDYRSNVEIYLFTLANGMQKKHTKEVLKKNESRIIVESDMQIKKGSYYLEYNPKKLIKIKYNE